jgi:large subunit ribosomal protein L24
MKELTSLGIRKNDTVQVIAGKEKGKTGKVLRVDPKSFRVEVENINMVKKHTKPSQANPGGGILSKTAPLHYSNVLLFCGKCKKGVRFGFKMSKVKTGTKKVRHCKKCDENLDKVTG